MESLVYVDGAHVPEAEARISVFDSALHYADGCFESMRVYNGRIFQLEAHLDRLWLGVRTFRLPLAMSRPELGAAIVNWLKANRVRDDYHFKLLITRGPRRPPRLDFRFAPGPATVVMMGNELHGQARPSVRVAAASTRRPNADSIDPRLKTYSWGANVLAKLEAGDRGVDDAVMLDQLGFVAAATASNVFAVHGGSLATPYPRACLRGITRQAVIGLAKDMGMPVVEADLTMADLKAAHEVFLTGTSSELIPVSEVDNVRVGDGETAGPLTSRLLAAYRKLARESGEPLL
jgi:branched-chain amino acid aminotransferase